MVLAGVSSLAAVFQSGASAYRALAPLDLTIIGVYFLVVFGIGFYFSRKERTSEEYFLAGRDIGWVFLWASLFGSNISPGNFIALFGTRASSGAAGRHFQGVGRLLFSDPG